MNRKYYLEMKNIFFSLLVLTAFVSCKNETKAEVKTAVESETLEKTAKQNDGLTLLKGEFVYYDGAAVLQTHASIYGVYINDKMLELNKLAEKHKSEPTDMVNIEVRAKVSNKKDDKILWENKVEIVEILNVTPQSKKNNNVVKLGNK